MRDLGHVAIVHGCGRRLAVLAIDVLVAVVEAVDVGLGNRERLAELAGQVHACGPTSSHITAALTAARAFLPMVNTPWLRISTAGER